MSDLSMKERLVPTYPGGEVARQAFDVLARRKLNKGCTCCDIDGWELFFDPVDGNWHCQIRSPYPVVQVGETSWEGMRGPSCFSAADPFTALIEADAWYVTNIESKREPTP